MFNASVMENADVEPLIRIAQYNTPPYANLCTDIETCDDPGLDMKLLIIQLLTMKFRVEFVTVETSDDIITALRNGTADVTCVTMTLVTKFYGEFLALNHLVNDKAMLVVKSAKIESRNLLFSMCHWNVWLTLLASIALIVTMKFLTADRFTSTRVTHVLWGLIFSVIFYTYTSLLAIIFSQNTGRPLPFQNFETFAEKIVAGKCALYINDTLKTDVWDLMPRGKNYERFLEALEIHPPAVVNGELNLIKKILQNDDDECRVGLIFKMERPLYEAISCDVRFLDFHEFPTIPYVYYYRRHFPYGERLLQIETSSDYDVIAMEKYAAERFVNNKIYDEPHASGMRCSQENGLNDVKPLTWRQLAQSFALLLLGYGIGALFLAISRISVRCNRFFHRLCKCAKQN